MTHACENMRAVINLLYHDTLLQVEILFSGNENKRLIFLSRGIFAGRKPGGHVREVGAETRVSSRGRIVKPVRRNERTQVTNTTQQQNGRTDGSPTKQGSEKGRKQ